MREEETTKRVEGEEVRVEDIIRRYGGWAAGRTYYKVAEFAHYSMDDYPSDITGVFFSNQRALGYRWSPTKEVTSGKLVAIGQVETSGQVFQFELFRRG